MQVLFSLITIFLLTFAIFTLGGSFSYCLDKLLGSEEE